MPGAKEETISQIEKRLAEIPMVSEMYARWQETGRYFK